MAEHEQEFVEYVVKALVEKPDAVQVQRSLDEKGVFLELTVDPEDVGKVIGKKGATINALRALLRVLGAKYDARYSLKVIEPEGFRDDRPSRDSESSEVNESAPVESDMSDEQSGDDGPSEHEMPDPAAVEADISAAETANSEANDESDADSTEVDDIKARAQEGLEDLDDFAV